MRIIAVNLQYICHSDSREKHPNAKASMYPASSKIITLVSFHLSSHHLYLGLLHCSHYVSMILSQSNSLALSLSAKVPLSAAVILINYHCRHVPVPESPRWQAWVKPPFSCWGGGSRATVEQREVRDHYHPSAQPSLASPMRWRQINGLLP